MRAQAFFGNLFKSDPSAATRQRTQARVDAINALEPSMQALTDEQLQDKTDELKRRAQGGEPLDKLLVEAFAVRVAAAGNLLVPSACMSCLHIHPAGGARGQQACAGTAPL